MGIFDFVKGIGKKNNAPAEPQPAPATPAEPSAQEVANKLLGLIKSLGLGVEGLAVTYNGNTDTAIIKGQVKSQADKEKTRQARAQLVEFKQEIEQETAVQDDFINQKIQKLKEKEQQRNQKRADKKPTEAKEKEKEKVDEPEVWKAGDKVLMNGNQNIGEILEINEKNAVVAFGQIRTSVSRDKLQKITNNEAKKIQRTYNQTMPNINKGMSEKRLTFKTEIDVRGQRAEEALQLIRSWIDDAIMLDFSELRILHGKGNGILKEMIRNYLKSEPAVRNYRDEHVQFGGAGITIIEIG